MNLHRIVALLITAIAIIGCSAPKLGYYNAPSELSRTEVFDKNYELGEVKTVAVGEPIVRIKNYISITRRTPYMTPTSDFTHTARGTLINNVTSQFIGYKGEKYKIAGQVQKDDKTLIALEVPNQKMETANHKGYMLITKDGVASPLIYWDMGAAEGVADIKHTIDPTDTRFETVGREFTESIKGSLNYELIYSGTDGDSFHISYREFTSDDLARTAFFQNLVYKTTDEVIRFRNHKIRIYSVDNQNIRYSVVEDGL